MRSETGKPEPARERQSRMRRGKAVRAFDPRFGAQVFEHEPRRRHRRSRHRHRVDVGQAAAECLDDDVGGVGGGQAVRTIAGSRRRRRAARRASRRPQARSARARAGSSIHRRTASACSRTSCRARRQQTPASPKLSTTLQKMSQRAVMAIRRRVRCAPGFDYRADAPTASAIGPPTRAVDPAQRRRRRPRAMMAARSPSARESCHARRAQDGVPVDRDVARDDRAQVRRVVPDRLGQPVVGRARVAGQSRGGAGRARRRSRGRAARRRPAHLRPRQGRVLLERRRGRADRRRGGGDHLVGGPPAASTRSRSRCSARGSLIAFVAGAANFATARIMLQGRAAARQHHDRGRREAPADRRLDLGRDPRRAPGRHGDAAVGDPRPADGDRGRHPHHRHRRRPAASARPTG